MRIFLLYILPIAIVAVGATVLWKGIQNLLYGYRSRRWPSVPGVITRSHVSADSNGERGSFVPHVSYDYSVNGVGYSNSRVTFGDETSRPADFAESACARYPIGQEAPVFYDPSDPAFSVLDSGPSRTAWLAISLGGFFIVVGLILFPFIASLFQAQ